MGREGGFLAVYGAYREGGSLWEVFAERCELRGWNGAVLQGAEEADYSLQGQLDLLR